MTLNGLDISHWQTGLQLGKTNLDFALMKATESTGYVDPTCNGFVNQAKKAGMLWGTYHFAQGGGTAEADHYLAATANYIGKGLMVLDWETNVSHVSAAKAWLDRVYDRTGIRAVIYMSQSVANSYNWSAVAKNHALWVARYNTSIGPTGAWNQVLMWQHTSSGKVPGYSGRVDLDRFYGTRDTWNAYVTGGTSPRPQPDTAGGGDTMANEVWNAELALWLPGDTNTKDTMPAGQQMNQARGYAQTGYQEAKHAHADARQIKQALRQLVKDPIFKGSTADHVNGVLKSE